MITLSNPLTQEERLQLARLTGHDLGNFLNGITGAIEGVIWNDIQVSDECKRELKRGTQVMNSVFHTIHNLVLPEEVYFLGQDFFVTEWQFNYLMDSLTPSNGKLSVRKKEYISFVSKQDLLYLIFHNLIKNSLAAQENIPKCDKKVDLFVEGSGFPTQALYIPDGARDYKEFVRFSVQNPGQFPRDKPLIDRLTICPPRGKHGFGLYFTGLAAKVLRAPVDIKSENGIVDVSFYQPIYPEEAGR